MAISCPYCCSRNSQSNSKEFIVSFGHFVRMSDNSIQKRFKCKACQKYFSTASTQLCFRQRKRHLNPTIFKTLASGMSQRRLAMILNVNRKTILRKFVFIGLHAQYALELEREKFEPATDVEFDDLETFEHTKLKPLSVTMLLESKTRRILGFKVARMPAKGLLVQKSLKKYGFRRDERKHRREQLFKELQPFISKTAIIKSDSSPHYPSSIRKYFPHCIHVPSLGKRGCVTGQGELKAGGFDPIFSLNHSFAMFRANINRLFRRTWNTTKKPERLSLHIAIYVLFHNQVLIHNPAR